MNDKKQCKNCHLWTEEHKQSSNFINESKYLPIHCKAVRFDQTLDLRSRDGG